MAGGGQEEEEGSPSLSAGSSIYRVPPAQGSIWRTHGPPSATPLTPLWPESAADSLLQPIRLSVPLTLLGEISSPCRGGGTEILWRFPNREERGAWECMRGSDSA